MIPDYEITIEDEIIKICDRYTRVSFPEELNRNDRKNKGNYAN
jgi:hypothetical protein